MDSHLWVLLTFLIIIASGVKLSEAGRIFTIINDCKETIWPAIIPGEKFGGGGFPLKAGESVVYTAPVGWSGRIWARTGCSFNTNGIGKCQTGSCGETLKCTGAGLPPTSLAEFTLAAPDFYDVSLVDGFNLPMAVTPLNGKGNCSAAGCDSDLRTKCPSELALKVNGKTVGCRSACDVFQSDEYCCKGVYANSATCKPTSYSKLFKQACPTAYSYAYDDPTSILTCTGTADYIIAFCSSRNRTTCTYHNNKLICSGSSSLKSLSGNLWVLIVSFTLINLWFLFVQGN